MKPFGRYCGALLLLGLNAIAGGAQADVPTGPYKELPVILTGSQLPAFAGVDEGSLAAFRYTSGSWFRFPLQVDGVYDVDTCQEADPPLPPVPAGADPQVSCIEKRIDFSGGHDAAGLDADDEVVFLAKEAGGKAPDNSHPAGVDIATRYEVSLADPRDHVPAYVYLYRQTGAAAATPYNISFTTAAGRLAPDDLPGDLSCPANQNQYTNIITDGYCAHWATRWSLDDLVLKPNASYVCSKLGNPGAADGSAPDEDPNDLLDRWKGHEQNVGNAVDDAYWGCKSRLLGEKKGPVRYVRGVLGAKSGVTTTLYSAGYPRYIRVETRLRVHPMPGIARIFDWNNNARGAAIYHGDNKGAGNGGNGTVDGNAANDTQQSHSLWQASVDQWDLLSAGVGRVFVYAKPLSDVTQFTNDPARGGKGFQYFYADQETPLNDPANREETKSSLGNFGNDFDLRTPKASCLAFCKATPEECESGTAASCTTGTYYQPFTVIHGLQILPAAAGNDGSDLAYVERTPLSITILKQETVPCTDGETRPCPLTKGVCAGTMQSCSGGIWQPCNYGPPFEPGHESTCDGLDNDCDGLADEEFQVGESCSVGIGECVRRGTWVCDGTRKSSSCSAQPAIPPEPGRELSCADGKDNDCDGQLDGADADCRSGCSDSDGDGFFVGQDCPPAPPSDCDDSKPAVHPGATEICNGIDDNCNGQVDEGFDVGQPCVIGVGACQRGGHLRCSADGARAMCDVSPGETRAEICGNGIDEDCDGADQPCSAHLPSEGSPALTPAVSSGGCRMLGSAAAGPALLALLGLAWRRGRKQPLV